MCRAHGNDRWCWRPKDYPFDGSTHIPVKAEEALEWAQSIDRGDATMETPPTNSERFNAMKKAHHRNQRQNGRGRLDDNPPPMNFSVYLDTQQIKQRSSDRYPRTPQRIRARSLDFGPSPVRGFSPREYNTEGLLAYLNWVDKVTFSVEYVDLYQSLFKERIGIDLFKRASGSETEEEKLYVRLKKDCLMPTGMALRLLQLFRDWQTSLADIH